MKPRWELRCSGCVNRDDQGDLYRGSRAPDVVCGAAVEGHTIGMIGGLALGTLVTLGLIPLLYEVLFGMKWPGSKRSHEAVQQPVQPV